VNYSNDQGHYLANGAPDSENARTLNTLLISDFRPEVAVQRFCARAVKNARKKDNKRHRAVSLRHHGFLVFADE